MSPGLGRGWHNQCGDEIGLHHSSVPPDIQPLTAVDQLRDHYRSATNSGLLQLDVVELDTVPAIKLITKIRQQPRGGIYLGSFIVPRRDFSYILQVGCPELGMTGVRESSVGSKLLEEGRTSIDEQGHMLGWASDPYDPSFLGELLRNLGDDEQYDAEFPDHPLSRLRRYLTELEPTIVISDWVREAAPFEGGPT